MTFELATGSIPEIGEDQLLESQPRVRALLVQRYEQVWTVVDGHIQVARELARPPDPRLLEIGLRVLKDEAMLYRLGRQVPVTSDADDEEPVPVDERVRMVAEQLAEIETKRQAADQAARDYLARQEATRNMTQESG